MLSRVGFFGTEAEGEIGWRSYGPQHTISQETVTTPFVSMFLRTFDPTLWHSFGCLGHGGTTGGVRRVQIGSGAS